MISSWSSLIFSNRHCGNFMGMTYRHLTTLQWHHNEHDGVSNQQPHNCLLNRLFRCRSKKTSKLCVTGLCKGNSLVTGEFPAQRASNAENVSIWWCRHIDRPYQWLSTRLWDILFWNLTGVSAAMPENSKYWSQDPPDFARSFKKMSYMIMFQYSTYNLIEILWSNKHGHKSE